MGTTPRRELTARAVRLEMSRRNITVDQLAHATRIPDVMLRARLAGDEPFDVDQLEAVAVALGVDVASLLAD